MGKNKNLPSWIRHETMLPTLINSIQNITRITLYNSYARKKMLRSPDRKGRRKVLVICWYLVTTLIHNNTWQYLIIYLKFPRFYKKLLQTIDLLRRVPGYKINTEMFITFLFENYRIKKRNKKICIHNSVSENKMP